MDNKRQQPTTQSHPLSGAYDEFPQIRRRILLTRIFGLLLALLLLSLLALILPFTVFQVSNPTITMNAVYFHDIRSSKHGSINITVVADISVRNPNSGTFLFEESLTEFCVGEEVVGSGRGAGMRVGAKETRRMNVSGVIVSGRGVYVSGFGGERVVRVRSRTCVEGKVRVMGVFKREVGVSMICNLSFESNRSSEAKVAGTRDCFSNVK